MQNAHEWVDHIIEVLFKADMRRLGKEITRLVERNNDLRGETSFGFMLLGQRYLDPRFAGQAKALAKFPMPTLSLKLHDEARAFNRDQEYIERDKRKIRQALIPLMINCNDMQEIRDSLPDCVVALIPQLATMTRKLADPTVHIHGDKFAMKAYEKALPLMQAYSVSALIF